MVRGVVRAVLVAAGLALAAPAVAADRVKSPEAEAAFTAGRYAEARDLIGRALDACRAPPDQPDRCLHLLFLAPSYAIAAGDGALAERWARQAVALASRPGGDEGERAITIVGLATAVMNEGRVDEAEALNREALALSRKALAETHPLTASIENSLALLLDARGRHTEAEPLHRAAIAGIRATLGERHPTLPTYLNALADNQAAQARYRDAEATATEALALARVLNGAQHPAVAFNLGSLGRLKTTLGRFDEAEALFREAESIDRAAYGPQHALVGQDVAALAGLAVQRGRLAEAETRFREALAIAEAASGPDHPGVASAAGNLAGVLAQLGRPDEAEPLTRRALAIDTAAFGDDNPRIASHLAALAALLEGQQRAAEAEPLRRRVLAIDRAAYGADHPETADDLSALAGNLSLLGNDAAAEPLLREALAVQEKALGADSLAVAGTLSQLGVLQSLAGKHAAAESLFRRALAIRRAKLGDAAPATAGSLYNLAAILERLDRPAEAEAPAREALRLRRALLPPQHPDIVASEALLARQLARRPPARAEALDHARAAMDIADARRRSPASLAARQARPNAPDAAARGKATEPDPLDRAYAAFLTAAAATGEAQRRRLAPDAFVAAQELGLSSAALAMAMTSARTAAGRDDLAALARRQQDLVAQVRALDGQAVAALGQGLSDKAAALRQEQASAAAALDAADEELRRRYPAYAGLVAPRPLTVAEVRARLAPGEGLLLVTPSGDDLFVFAVGPRDVAWRRLPGGAASVAARVDRLRCAVDPLTCTKAAGFVAEFDLDAAHTLYRDVIAPVAPALRGARVLLVSAQGPLADLPLDLLVAAPATAADRATRLRRTVWLGDRYALASLPSVSVLQRAAARTSTSLAFVGYGDPLLGVRAPKTGDAALDALRRMDPLPGTRVELTAMARALDAPADRLVLGAAADEAAVRADPRVRTADVVAFATHGLLPGELNGRNEPGLVFSPPATASAADDGLLSASEVAGLTLRADWVVLSACNTASGAGGSDSLSALARAFLYAGARALLASHWRVADEPTAALTVEIMQAARADPQASRAEARQRAMVAVRTGRRADGSTVAGWTPEWLEPAAWAPFSLIAASGR